MQGSEQELSPQKTSDLISYGNGGTLAGGRRPEQRHTRERASYGGVSTSGAAEIFGVTSEEAFPTPYPDVANLGSDVEKASKVSLSSPIASSIQSPENFNVIKSVHFT